MFVENMPSPVACKNESIHWENRPFIHQWPEMHHTSATNKGIRKTITKRSKRVRTAFSTLQLEQLETIFAKRTYINAEERTRISKEIGIADKPIKIWFQNRRMKMKKEKNSDSSSDCLSEDSIPSPRSMNESPQPSICTVQSSRYLNDATYTGDAPNAVTPELPYPEDFHKNIAASYLEEPEPYIPNGDISNFNNFVCEADNMYNNIENQDVMNQYFDADYNNYYAEQNISQNMYQGHIPYNYYTETTSNVAPENMPWQQYGVNTNEMFVW